MIWSPRAIFELAEQGRWLSQRDARAAELMVEEIGAAALKLGWSSDVGRPGRFEGTREFSIVKWHKVLIYELREQRVEIITIIDTRSRPPEAL